MEREIRVYATGTHRALPDCIRATVRLAGLKDTYEAAAEEFKDSFEFLLKETKQFVFKTADFSINTHYADERDGNNVWRKKFAGFMFSHTLVCEFPFDTSALGAFVFTLGRCKCVDSFGFDYAVTDEDGAYDAAAADAVKKAVKKANVLAAAAGVKLAILRRLVSTPLQETYFRRVCAKRTTAQGGHDGVRRRCSAGVELFRIGGNGLGA